MIFYQNAQSLNNKLSDLHINFNLCLSPPDILGFSETWLDSSFDNNELKLAGYNIFRCDRSPTNSTSTKGGGVLLAVKNSIQVLEIINNINVEEVFVRCNINSTKVIVGCVYIPHCSMTEHYKNHCSTIQMLSERFSDDQFIIMGNFNRLNVTWLADPLRTEHTCYLSPNDLDVNSRLCYTYSGINAAQH